MATHKVKPNTVAQLWDKPETGRANKGQLQAGTAVTVSETRILDNTGYAKLSSHNGLWTKSMWLVATATSNPIPEPPPPLPIPFPEPSGNVRKIRKWGDPVTKEYRYDVNLVGSTNWQNFKTWNDKTGWGAVANFLWIPRGDIDRLKALQIPDTHTVDQKMNWLCSQTGKIYMRSPDWRTDAKIAWGTTAIGGNYVKVVEYRTMNVPDPKGGSQKVSLEMALLAGFRKTDWGRPLNDLVSSGLVHRCYCAYKNNQFGDSPNGVVYSPFWSPMDWDFAGNLQPSALWLPSIWFE